MAGPFADYWIATPNKVLSHSNQVVAKLPKGSLGNVVEGMVGLLQVQVHTENTNALRAELLINGNTVFVYGPTSTNMTRVLQAPILPNTFQYDEENLITGVVVSGSGSFKVDSMAIFWQAA